MPPSLRSDSHRVARGLARLLCVLALCAGAGHALAQDADGDGLSDGAEAQIGSNPALADTDGDGDDDWLEFYRCRNPLLAADRGPHNCAIALQNLALGQTPGIAWSETGPIAGMNCVRVTGGSDGSLWPNTFLCTRPFVAHRWNILGPVPGFGCVLWNELSDPFWSDFTKYLCAPPSLPSPIGRFPTDFFFSSSGTAPAGSACVPITNALKPTSAGWTDNRYCVRDSMRTFDSAQCLNCDSDDLSNGPLLTANVRTPDNAVLAETAPLTLDGQECTPVAGQPGQCRLPAAPFANLGARRLLSSSDRWTVQFGFGAPRIDTITPATPPGGAGIITLDGVRFGYGAPVVVVGTQPCILQQPVRNTRITCTLPILPAGSASVQVLVGGQLSNTRTIEIVPPAPVIASVAPLAGLPTQGGGVLRIQGVNLDRFPWTATVGGSACTPVSTTATELRCTVPAGQGRNVPVAVTVGSVPFNGTLNYDAPRIDLVEGQDGPTSGGTLVTLVGANFGTGSATQATIDGQACLPSGAGVSHTQVQCLLPAGEGRNRALIVTVGGQSGPAVSYNYGAPRVETVQGSGGPTQGGNLVTITGRNFGFGGAGFTAAIDGVPCVVGASGSVTHTEVRCTAPPGQGVDRPVFVVVAQQYSNNDRTYSYGAPSASVSGTPRFPTAGGTVLDLIGSNFGTSGMVTVANRVCTPVSYNHTRIQCLVPPGSGLAQQVRLFVSGQQALLSVDYRAPTISTVAPLGGPTAGGGTLTLMGSDFGEPGLARPRTVTVGGRPCPILNAAHSSIACTLPAGEGTALTVAVEVDAQPATAAVQFSYLAPVLLDLSPGAMPLQGGLDLELIGTNLGLQPQVLVDGVACPVTPGSGTHFRVRCRAPARSAGTALVQLVAGTQPSNTLPLAYDAAPVLVSITKAGTAPGVVSANRLGLSCGIDCSAREGLVPGGAQVEFTAQSVPGARFVRWQGACTGSQPTCSFAASADSSVVAVFEDTLFGSGFELGEPR